MNKLTDNSIENAEILEKQYKIYDGNGMFLLVHPNGSKYWRMKYTFDGKSKLASFGVWPKVSLNEAREKRQKARQKIKMGINPVEEKRNKKIKLMISTEKTSFDEVKGVEPNTSDCFSKLYSPQRIVEQTDALLMSLKSIVYECAGDKSFSWVDKDELSNMLGKIYRNRSDLYKIIWSLYLSLPVTNIAVLFVLLMILIDFLPALFTTILYFFLTVCSTVVYSLWVKTKLEK